jgi:hypothetical protein
MPHTYCTTVTVTSSLVDSTLLALCFHDKACHEQIRQKRRAGTAKPAPVKVILAALQHVAQAVARGAVQDEVHTGGCAARTHVARLRRDAVLHQRHRRAAFQLPHDAPGQCRHHRTSFSTLRVTNGMRGDLHVESRPTTDAPALADHCSSWTQWESHGPNGRIMGCSAIAAGKMCAHPSPCSKASHLPAGKCVHSESPCDSAAGSCRHQQLQQPLQRGIISDRPLNHT